MILTLFLLTLTLASTLATDIAALKKAADAQFALGEVSNSIGMYSQIIELERKSQLNYFKRAAAYLVNKSYSLALNDLEEALRLDRTFVKGLLYRGKINKILGNYENSKLDYNNVLEIQPNNKEAKNELVNIDKLIVSIQNGDNLLEHNRFNDAKVAYSQALDISADSTILLMKRARCNIELAEYGDIIADMGSVLKVDKNNIEALYLRGSAYYYMGELDVALRHFKEALKQDPDHRKTMIIFKKLRSLDRFKTAAEEAWSKGDHRTAHEEFKSALKVDENHPLFRTKFLLSMCDASFKLNKFDASIEECSQVLSTDGNNFDALLFRGESHMMKQDFDKAQKDFQTAAQQNPHDQRVQQAMHKLQLEQKKASRKDYYKLLGLEAGVSDSDIKRAFKKLALQLHPDKLMNIPEDERKEKEILFRDVAEAYDVLTDPEKRAKWERGEDIEPNQGGQQQHNPFQNFGNFFQQGGGGGFPGGGGGFQFHFN